MEVVIERDSQHDRLIGRVERRWPHGTSASEQRAYVLMHHPQMMSAVLFHFKPLNSGDLSH